MKNLIELSTASHRQAKEEKARRALQRDFTLFKHYMYKRYQHARHLQVFDEHLMQVARYVETGGKEGIAFLISEMPPRHGKTFTLSRFFPTWFLGRNPDARVMTVSYGQSLADKNSRLARNLIPSPWYQAVFPDVQLDTQSKAVNAWNLEGHEGGMDALGVLGASTGKGANLLVCDDLVAGRDEAESEVIRERTWDAFNDDLMTRLEPGGAVVLNATRWHVDDPTGRVLKHFKEIYGDKMVRLRFPAIAEEDDVLGRNVGEALWPERYPIEVLRTTEARMSATGGLYSWSALYQQSPVFHEGGLFKYAYFDPLVNNPPEILYAWRFWDLAMSSRDTADFTVGVKIGQAVDGHYYVLDVARKRIDWGEVTPYMAEIMLADGSKVQQGIEQKGYMSRAVTDLNLDPRLNGYAIFGHDVDTDKRTRALPFAAKCAAGVVHVVNAHWTEAYIEELCLFTGSGDDMHDDQVDASSGAWAMTALGDAMASVADNGYAPMAGSY
jgi:predicted phage terminase large subunit-like protein